MAFPNFPRFEDRVGIQEDSNVEILLVRKQRWAESIQTAQSLPPYKMLSKYKFFMAGL